MVRLNHAPSATVYISAHLVPSCIYYTSWRSVGGAVTETGAADGCTIPGTRVILGTWPDHDRADGNDGSRGTWAGRDIARMRAAAAGELWLILAGEQATFVSMLEASGASRVSQRHLRGVTAYTYRFAALVPEARVPPNAVVK